MAMLEIRDHVVWAKHIHGDTELRTDIEGLPADELIELVVDGRGGIWKKMEDGADGRPTPGIKPLGVARNHWHALQEKRGDLVSVSRALSSGLAHND